MPQFLGKGVTNERLLAKANPSRWRSLSLLRTQVDDDGLNAVCEVALNLEQIEIQSESISDDSMPALCRLPKLRSLLFQGVPRVTDAGIAHVAHAKELRELYLADTQLTNVGVESFKGLQHVWSLTLDGTRINDSGVARLAALPKLHLLRLNRTRIEGWGLAALPNAERFDVYLEGCPLTDRGICEFVATHDRLRRLSLNETPVTDRCLLALSRLHTIEDLRLNGTAVTDDGIQAFLAHPSLSSIDLRQTAVTEDVILQLEAASRKLIVFH